MALADRVALMNKGRIEQIGSPSELDATPASPFVFTFLGETNRLPCRIENGRASFPGFAAPVITPRDPADGLAVALFRPEDTVLAAEADAEGLPVTIVEIRGRGALRQIDCAGPNGEPLTAEIAAAFAQDFRANQPVRLVARRVALAGPES
jgi:sulfate transport system ATP-binding protein